MLEIQSMKVLKNLMTEVLQDNTKDVLRTAVIALSNSIRSADAVKKSKVSFFKVAIQRMATNYSIGSKPSRNKKQAEENAGRIIGVINLLFQIEDIFTVLKNQFDNVTKTHNDYMEELKKEYPDREPIEPPLQTFLGNNARFFRVELLKVLTGKAAITKDPQTIGFQTKTKDLTKPAYQLFAENLKDPMAKQIMNLTYDEFFNLVNALGNAIPNIKAVKNAVGTATAEELRTQFFRIPSA